MKRDDYRDKYTKPKRKEATRVEYNLAVQAHKMQKRPQTTKRLQNNNKATQQDTNKAECPICKLQFLKRGIKQHITKTHNNNKSDQLHHISFLITTQISTKNPLNYFILPHLI